MLKNRLFYISILIIVSFIYIFTNTYYTFGLLIFVIVLPLISFIFMLISRKSVSIDLKLAPILEKDDVTFTITFKNHSVFPIAGIITWVKMENQFMAVNTHKKIHISLGIKKTNEARLLIQNAKIGAITVSMNKVRIYDIFGLFSVKYPDSQSESTVVYPKMLDMEIHMDKPVETSGDGNRYSPDKKGMDISEIFALRDYIAGDEIRKIHWKLSSKMDKVIVRDFSLPLNYSVFLLIELNKSKENIMDTMIELYLSLSRVLLSEGINHNLAWYDENEENLKVHELDTFSDLEVAMAELLMSFAYDENSIALDHYMTSAYKSNEVRLIYISTDPDIEKISEFEMSQRMKTIYIKEKDNIDKIDSIEIYTVYPGNIEDGLTEFII